jgi:hypothetical protein
VRIDRHGANLDQPAEKFIRGNKEKMNADPQIETYILKA